MNFKTFVAALDDNELSELSRVIMDRREINAKEKAKDIVLTDDEKETVLDCGRIEGIKVLRARTGIDIYTARQVIENYIEEGRKIFIDTATQF